MTTPLPPSALKNLERAAVAVQLSRSRKTRAVLALIEAAFDVIDIARGYDETPNLFFPSQE